MTLLTMKGIGRKVELMTEERRSVEVPALGHRRSESGFPRH